MLPEPEDLYINVGLREYVPTDQMQKINAAQMMTSSMPYPSARALEALDVADPEVAFEEWKQEQLDKAAVQMEVADMQFEQQMRQQEKALEMQMKQQEQMQQAQQPQQPAPDQMQANMAGQAPFAAMQGQGFNPAMGGTPPAMGAPDFTRETITGVPKAIVEGRDNRGLGNVE